MAVVVAVTVTISNAIYTKLAAPDYPTDLCLVEVDIGVPQPENQGVDPRPDQLVHWALPRSAGTQPWHY